MMRQIIQHIRDGTLRVVEVPDTVVKPGHVLVANAFSVILAGTEKMLIDLGKKSLLVPFGRILSSFQERVYLVQ